MYNVHVQCTLLGHGLLEIPIAIKKLLTVTPYSLLFELSHQC